MPQILLGKGGGPWIPQMLLRGPELPCFPREQSLQHNRDPSNCPQKSGQGKEPPKLSQKRGRGRFPKILLRTGAREKNPEAESSQNLQDSPE